MTRKPAPLAERFWRKVTKQPGQGCWLWRTAQSCPHHYGSISIQIGPGQHRNVGTHRLSWEMHYGPIPPGFFVCHVCDNRPCVRPDHLMLGNIRSNFFDARRKGRIPILHGEQTSGAKLTAADVATIVALRGKMSQREIGERFGITQGAVKDIQLGKRWRPLQLQKAAPMTPSAAAAKLTPQQVYAIRALRGTASQREIAQQFGISQQHVGRIYTRIDWKHLPDPGATTID